ncbi:uncharacterized protein GGS22DRAFT_186309 [Annulohypoxylon maeteangense]|uniref:uncharacterized protein n=1 Tax=Annulohypoxylon maeteangense TaxID=1927788 RepID=UPI00200790C4|nr:uncharacterized protein GGS22DRAFT_186309 [Annulohypoxylon maeteangense]KAI0887477.1 hypothetical protein GGS22DRAFT_186309 [Annulohypoxylon maeteangense]
MTEKTKGGRGPPGGLPGQGILPVSLAMVGVLRHRTLTHGWERRDDKSAGMVGSGGRLDPHENDSDEPAVVFLKRWLAPAKINDIAGPASFPREAYLGSCNCLAASRGTSPLRTGEVDTNVLSNPGVEKHGTGGKPASWDVPHPAGFRQPESHLTWLSHSRPSTTANEGRSGQSGPRGSRTKSPETLKYTKTSGTTYPALEELLLSNDDSTLSLPQCQGGVWPFPGKRGYINEISFEILAGFPPPHRPGDTPSMRPGNSHCVKSKKGEWYSTRERGGPSSENNEAYQPNPTSASDRHAFSSTEGVGKPSPMPVELLHKPRHTTKMVGAITTTTLNTLACSCLWPNCRVNNEGPNVPLYRVRPQLATKGRGADRPFTRPITKGHRQRLCKPSPYNIGEQKGSGAPSHPGVGISNPLPSPPASYIRQA